MATLIGNRFNYAADSLPINDQSYLINFFTALGYKNLEMGVCFGIQRMGTQAVCAKEFDVFNSRINRIHNLWIKCGGSYSRVAKNLRKELSEAITKEDASTIESAVDLMAFAECVAFAQGFQDYGHLIDQENLMNRQERLLKIKELTYSQEIESLGGLETIGIAIDQYSPETFEKYIRELKTLAESVPIEFLILELNAENHAVTIIYSSYEQSWYCIDANNLPIYENKVDQEVSKWVFERYNIFYPLAQNRRIISTNLQVLGKDGKFSNAFETWREIQKNNRLLELTPEEVNQRNHFNTAPLQAVARLQRLPGCSYAAMISSLLDRGADVNYIDKSSATALMDVVKADDIKAAIELLHHGADIDIKKKNGWTALMIASRNGNREILKVLLDAKADLNLINIHGCTALMIATRYRNRDIVKDLLEAGADFTVETDQGWTALMIAKRYGDTEIVEALLAAGAMS